MSEELVVRHCSPTLAGLKTANMFSCPFESEIEAKKDIRILNKKLSDKGLRTIYLRYSNSKALVYIYRPAKLKADLNNHNSKKILSDIGYYHSKNNNPEKCLLQLIGKLNENEDFPHEIGLFLGYPPEDVLGFIKNRAYKYKCSGCWKVYGDEQAAKKTFEKYKKCSGIYYRKWQQGRSLEQLTVAL